MAGALPQESGLFSLVEMETADGTVLIAVPMTTEIRGRTRRDSAEWAKGVFLQHKKNAKIGMMRSDAAQNLSGTRDLRRLSAAAGLFHGFENLAPSRRFRW